MAMEAAEQALWRRYRGTRDPDAREFLFLQYSPWSRSIAAGVARRVRHPALEWADYLQNAHIGLLEAISRYDVERGIDFMAYAKPRVRGAVFNGMRTFARSDRAAERLRATGDRVESIQRESEHDLLAGFIDTVLGVGIGHLLETGGSPDPHAGGPDPGLASILDGALLRLPDRQRKVLASHYLRQVPFQEIAKELGLSKGRVSQIHKAALLQVRHILREGRYDKDAFF